MTHATALDSAFARVEALGRRCKNFDTLVARNAARNLANHQPAFWSSASGSNDIVWMIVIYANEHQGMLGGIEAMDRDFTGKSSSFREVRWLDKILPLNDQAATDLARMFIKLNTFRTAEELSRRTDRAEGFDMGSAAA